jgi:plastocyanin
MDYDTIFYICGGVLAVAAVLTSFIGLRSEKFPGRATPVVVLVFLALIGVTTTYSVLNGQQEEEHREHELEHANAEAEHLEEEPVGEEHGAAEAGEETGAAEGGEKAPEGGKDAAAGGPGGTLQLAASETDIAYDTTELSSKPGKVTIDFTNPALLEHDVAIERDGQEIAKSETIAKGETSVSADLAPGEYTFLCTVPGHAEAGMEGTLTVR